jgi:UDP-glucose 4-epimerase
MSPAFDRHNRGMRALVTGGAGYIGSVVAARLVGTGHEVAVIDDLSTGHEDAVPEGAAFFRTGVAEAADVLRRWKPDAVVHFAARSLVAESVAYPAGYWHTNVAGTLALLDAMRAHDVARIVFSSTAATYGEPPDMPIRESAATLPTNPYGMSKLAVDHALGSYARAYGLAAVSLRYFNVAGALHTDTARLGERHRTETHLVPLALRAAAGGEPLQVFGTDYPTPDGTCVRDYVHVVDLADAHIRALDATVAAEHLIVNLGSGTGYSVREVIDTVGAVVGRPVPVVESPRRPGDPPVLVAAIDRARDVLGWRPIRGLQQMIDDAWRFASGA